jgi:hypothetical protein
MARYNSFSRNHCPVGGPVPLTLLLLWHGNGWDELLLMGGAVAVAIVIVKFTMRDGDGPADSPTPET